MKRDTNGGALIFLRNRINNSSSIPGRICSSLCSHSFSRERFNQLVPIPLEDRLDGAVCLSLSDNVFCKGENLHVLAVMGL